MMSARKRRGGAYWARSGRSRLVLYGLVALVSLWLIGPFVWLFVTSVSYQKHLMARPLSFVPPLVTMASVEPNESANRLSSCVVSRAYPPFASRGETRIVLLCRVTVRFRLVFGPTTDGVETASVLMRRW